MVERPARLQWLELLRFVLAGAVVAYHFYWYGPLKGVIPEPAARQLGFPYLLFAVHAFFVISGFVILLTVGGRSPADFLIARIKRLGPALLVCSLATYLALHAVRVPELPRASGTALLGSILVLPLAAAPAFHTDWSLWSLYYEVRFYLALFGLMIFFDVGKYALRVAAAMVAIDLALVLVRQRWPAVDQVNQFGPCLPFFAMGILLFVLHQRGRIEWGWMLTMAGAVIAGGFRAGTELQDVAAELHLQPIAIWHGFVVSAGAVALVWGLSRTAGSRAGKAFTVLGAMSYPLYLLHQFIGYALIAVAVRLGIGFDVRPFVVAFVLGASYLIATRLEPVLAPIYGRGLTWMRNRTFHSIV